MSALAFTKMHGLGNDFVVVDATREPFTLVASQIRRLADRRLGVGCDQVLGVVVPWAYAALVTLVLLKLIDKVVGLRVHEEDEHEGLDTALHGETGYNLESGHS